MRKNHVVNARKAKRKKRSKIEPLWGFQIFLLIRHNTYLDLRVEILHIYDSFQGTKSQ